MLLVAHQAIVRFGNVTVTPIATLGQHTIKLQPGSNGSIIVDPDKPTYNYGERVTVRALAKSGYKLSNWSGDLSGDANPYVFDITQDMTIRSNFVTGTDPTLTVSVVGGGTVNVNPQKSTYQNGELVTLTPQPAAGSIFAGWSGDLTTADNPASLVMNANKNITATFVLANPSSPESDDFSACVLNEDLWTFINPVGDGTFAMTGTDLALTAPAGLSHNIWLEGNRSVRVMQPTADGAFEIVAKFDSQVTQRFQMQGILVEQDNKNFLRLEVHHDGATVEIYAAKFVNGNPEAVIQKTALATTPPWLRVTRTDGAWGYSYSFDGNEWLSAGSFEHELTVTSTGVFSGNHSSGLVPPPEHITLVDYFFNSAAPIVPEDGGSNSLNVTVQGEGTVTKAPDKPVYTCGETVTVTASPAPGWQFSGWSGGLTGTEPVKQVTMNGVRNVTATFVREGGAAFKIYLPSVLR